MVIYLRFELISFILLDYEPYNRLSFWFSLKACKGLFIYFRSSPLLHVYYFDFWVGCKNQRCAVNDDTVLLLSVLVRVDVLNWHSSPLMMAQVILLRILNYLPKWGHSSWWYIYILRHVNHYTVIRAILHIHLEKYFLNLSYVQIAVVYWL